MKPEILYPEVCSNIRQTDTISAALLGFVPVVSGSAIMALLSSESDVEPPIMVAISLLGIVVTFGLFMWEKRNIDSCKKLRDIATELEKDLAKNLQQFTIIKKAKPTLFGFTASKTHAEKIIYGAALLAWLVPFFCGISACIR